MGDPISNDIDPNLLTKDLRAYKDLNSWDQVVALRLILVYKYMKLEEIGRFFFLISMKPAKNAQGVQLYSGLFKCVLLWLKSRLVIIFLSF